MKSKITTPKQTQSKFRDKLTRFSGGLVTSIAGYLVLVRTGMSDEKIIAFAAVCGLVFQLGVYLASKRP